MTLNDNEAMVDANPYHALYPEPHAPHAQEEKENVDLSAPYPPVDRLHVLPASGPRPTHLVPTAALVELQPHRALEEHKVEFHTDPLKERLLHSDSAVHGAVTVHLGDGGEDSGASDAAASDPPGEPVPRMPWVMVILIASINLNEAFQQNVIWPFIPAMVRDFRVGSESENGFYAGVLGSSFFLAQLLSSLAWGVISDRIGRRFVLLYGTAMCTCATLVFGLATTYPVALAARFMAGFLAGNLGTSKTYLSEELDRSLLAKGLSALGFSAGLGGIIGPIVGGYLNNPAKQYPSVFSEGGLFGQFPYLLPELISVAIGGVGFVISIRYLPESRAFVRRLQLKREAVIRAAAPAAEVTVRQSNVDGAAVREASAPVSDREAVQPESVWTVVKRKQVLVCTGLYGLIALVHIMYDEIFSFFLQAETRDQGFGYSSARTGSFLAVTGVSLIAFQLMAFPPLVARVGVIRLFRVSLLLAIPFFFVFPALSNLERSDVSPELTALLLAAACVFRAVIGANLFTPVFMLINGSAPQASLGAVNGLGQTQAAFWRTIGPLVGGGVWSLSLGWGGGWAEVHHFAVYAIVAALTALTYGVSLMLRRKVNEDDEDEDDGAGERSKGGERTQRHQTPHALPME